MTDDEQGRKGTHRRLWLALAVVLALLAIVIVPPLLSVSRYKNSITRLVSASLGRPVRLSSVELRVLPRPGFVLTNLTVEEDPAYGAEPLLHASTVTASIRLLSLWRGRLEINRISVDDASLNLVRTAGGRWNVETLFTGQTGQTGKTGQAGQAGGDEGLLSQRRKIPLPYLEATNSRINIKNGVEKLPFSLVETDASFWQENPGDWRIRLRGQPARTDVSLDLADTGIVRLEGHLHQAAELQQMPVHLDLVWREAQLGQLSRLVIGSDPGWRGALTGELHLDGTADSAQVKTRLTATGVHRAEFAPAAPMDFDANCGFIYHHPTRAVEKLVCDSPLGDGHIRLAGDLPGGGVGPRLSVELDRIPVAAGLDALRTVRSGFGPGLVARGLVSGKINYAADADESATKTAAHAWPGKTEGKTGSKRAEVAGTPGAGPLTGSFTVEGFQLSGDGLREPIVVQKLVLEPVPDAKRADQTMDMKAGTRYGGGLSALMATMAVPAGGVTPLTVITRLAVSGYQVTVKGPAAIVRARELAHVAGMADAGMLDGLAGEAAQVDLSAEGPWLAPVDTSADSLSGTVGLHNVNWKADYLANHVEIAQATLRLDASGEQGAIRWDPVVFSYGPVRGTATVDLPESCIAGPTCKPRFTVQFGALDAAALQAAILGAHEQGTMLSELIARFKPSTAPVWPELDGTVRADSLILGPVTLVKPSATLRILSTGAEITGLDAEMLGGRVYGSGMLHTGDKPDYSLEGKFEKLSPAKVGELLGLKWSGGVMDADGKVELSGFTDKDLTASANGTVHFAWRHGTMSLPAAVGQVPSPPMRFENWTADAGIANGAITLKQNEIREGVRKRELEGLVTLGDPPKVRFTPAKETQAKR
ncbi:MAG: AsmA family protein [Terracidiphilus sp.]|jgi:uncharacterized protein involved in outer membrane biogenesis